MSASADSPRKIRVVHYCNQLGIGGTERSMELFCKYLDPERFDVLVVSRIHREKPLRKLRIEAGALLGFLSARAKKKLLAQMNVRVRNFQEILGPERVHFAQTPEALRSKLLELSPDILHVWYSGTAEPPTSDEAIMSQVPVTVTTNSFEIQNTSPAHRLVRQFYFPSHWLFQHRAQWAKDDPRAGVFYCPIEEPATKENLREQLEIPADAFVIGRVGRADPGIHDPISLRAFQEIEDGKTYFLALSPPENMISDARAMGLKNFISMPPSAEPLMLARFYNTIDVLAHARRDGETFGCNIAEAMMHGKPVVSHLSAHMNAQTETIGDAGWVCGLDDWREYAGRLRALRDDPGLREEYSKRAYRRAREQFEVKALTKRLEDTYLKLLESR